MIIPQCLDAGTILQCRKTMPNVCHLHPLCISAFKAQIANRKQSKAKLKETALAEAPVPIKCAQHNN